MKRALISIIGLVLGFGLGLAVITLTGCSEAQKVSYNVSRQADNFNVTRRLTVINTRSDKPILQMVGKISIEDVENGIAVLVEVDRKKGIYQKHWVYLNDWTMYTVEDVSGMQVSKYAYEIEFMPQTLAPIRLTTDELQQDVADIITSETEKDEE